MIYNFPRIVNRKSQITDTFETSDSLVKPQALQGRQNSIKKLDKKTKRQSQKL